ncbi:ACT domain-containing protein [Caldithrix abyssi]|uniref:UPF0237 protein Cabys_2140 n=2 Tax=Caldithrix abyssi TaxID=187145 RepID=H1XV19_CALAY|nr:ACT domain-containing protein [Caldithrix abyssi]APF18889.1 ACT domain-containing protein [Caldithrix abyssi DSM 13497]EHO42852.1 ACT domain-containing protein [Caldithrix abyssi DSM 13497]
MELNEKDIKKIAEEAIKQLGQTATPQAVEKVVTATIDRLQKSKSEAPVEEWRSVKSARRKTTGERIIITAFGKNRVGILAKMTEVLAKNNCDILDLTQKLMQEFFTIMLLVDISSASAAFDAIKHDLLEAGEALDLKVIVQHEEIFNAMHRI